MLELTREACGDYHLASGRELHARIPVGDGTPWYVHVEGAEILRVSCAVDTNRSAG